MLVDLSTRLKRSAATDHNCKCFNARAHYTISENQLQASESIELQNANQHMHPLNFLLHHA